MRRRTGGGRLWALMFALCPALAGCGGTLTRPGPPASHYSEWKVAEPRGNTVEVCSSYGCRTRQRFTFTSQDIAALRAIMIGAEPAAGPVDERRRIGHAISWIERRVGPATGTASDRALLDFLGNGDPSQMDCVDEATNTTSYLLVMAHNGLIRHHGIEKPMAKGGFTRWPHYGAVVVERASGRRWVIDSSVRANGQPPVIQPAESWYMPG